MPKPISAEVPRQENYSMLFLNSIREEIGECNTVLGLMEQKLDLLVGGEPNKDEIEKTNRKNDGSLVGEFDEIHHVMRSLRQRIAHNYERLQKFI